MGLEVGLLLGDVDGLVDGALDGEAVGDLEGDALGLGDGAYVEHVPLTVAPHAPLEPLLHTLVLWQSESVKHPAPV